MTDNPLMNTERYFAERMALLGISEDMLEIDLYTDSFRNANFHKVPNKKKPYNIIEPNERGIGILLYTIRGKCSGSVQ